MKWYPNFLLIFWPAKCRTVTQLSTVFQERNGSIIVINFVYLPYVYLTVRSIDWCNKMFSRDSSFFFLCKYKFDFVDDCSYQRSHFACWLKEPMKQSVEKHEVSLTKMLLSASGRNTACTSMVPAIVPAFETFKVKSFSIVCNLDMSPAFCDFLLSSSSVEILCILYQGLLVINTQINHLFCHPSYWITGTFIMPTLYIIPRSWITE